MFLMCLIPICVSIIELYPDCTTIRLDSDKSAKVLTADYSVSCRTQRFKLYSAYLRFALVFYAFLVPLGLLLKLASNRRDTSLTRAELVAKDGPLAVLTYKYSRQFYWVEFCEIYARLMFAGGKQLHDLEGVKSDASGTMLLFPHTTSIRLVALMLILLALAFLGAQFKPIVSDSHHTLSMACLGYLSIIARSQRRDASVRPPFCRSRRVLRRS